LKTTVFVDDYDPGIVRVDADRERGTRVVPVVTSSELDEETIRSALVGVSVFGDVFGAVTTGDTDPGVARRKVATLVQQQTGYRVRLSLIHCCRCISIFLMLSIFVGLCRSWC
jgi:hypothetical protein